MRSKRQKGGDNGESVNAKPAELRPSPLRYTHAAARLREGMRLTQEETRALVHVELWTNEAIAYVDMDIPAARRALDKLRRGLELYEAKGKG